MRAFISLLPRIVLCLVPVAIAGASHAAGDASAPPVPIPAKGSVILQAESGRIDPDRAVIVEQESFGSKKGVSLKEGAAANVGTVTAEPDLVFRVRAAEPGRYVIRTHAATDAKGTEAMRRARSKHDSVYLMLAVGKGRPTRRVVFVPWRPAESCSQTLGTFALAAGEQAIRIWLPEGVRLDYVQLAPYTPPKVPAEAVAYQPPVVPPAGHPRVWVNAQSLATVCQNLAKGENAPLWAQIQKQASKPYEFHVAPGAEVGYDARLERAAVHKAFVYLMTGDKDRGREAVALVRDYLAAVEFGNLLDITREIGRAIYSASLVYDWCYDLMSPDDRAIIRRNLMRLAEDMEIGWPPFRQMIINGHGNEAQVNRDLLSMAIAIYDEDPEPYRYCAYRILEELAPMRRFEYQSPRHNQGVSYGPYRFGWDMHAAWLFYRMSGQRVFDDNICDVCKFWLYMRVPTGETLRDGDGFSDGRPANLGATALLASAYACNPVFKGDFERQGGLPGDPILVLLLNDPDLKAKKGLDSLPQTIEFGPVLGSMVARTGWNMGPNRSDVIVEMKGGGYHFGNHQHSDAGSFQIYYRGLQAADLGQYHFYGTPYDYNFCKRSVAHSMMLAVDPDETFRGATSNDGGTRFVRSCPRTPEQARSDPTFANGTILSADFGPSPQRPFYSYFSVDLTSAYSRKITSYVRTFCFLNLDNPENPAVLIVLDNMTTAKPEFTKYWQVNTLQPPQPAADGVILTNQAFGRTGKVDVRMFRPAPADRNMQILSGKDAYSVSGQYFAPPKPDRPEANGHRVTFTPKEASESDLFLTVLSMREEQAARLPVDIAELPDAFVLTLADRVVVLNKTGELLAKPLALTVRSEGNVQLLVTGLAPGPWSLSGEGGQPAYNTHVNVARNAALFVVPAGEYTLRPGMLPGAPVYEAPPEFMPAPSQPIEME